MSASTTSQQSNGQPLPSLFFGDVAVVTFHLESVVNMSSSGPLTERGFVGSVIPMADKMFAPGNSSYWPKDTIIIQPRSPEEIIRQHESDGVWHSVNPLFFVGFMIVMVLLVVALYCPTLQCPCIQARKLIREDQEAILPSKMTDLLNEPQWSKVNGNGRIHRLPSDSSSSETSGSSSGYEERTYLPRSHQSHPMQYVVTCPVHATTQQKIIHKIVNMDSSF